MIRSLKILTVLTLATAIAAPALAKAPHARRDGTAAAVAAIVAAAAAADGPLRYESPYRWQNNNLNPDFQLGGDR
jgi:hypothetical protein